MASSTDVTLCVDAPEFFPACQYVPLYIIPDSRPLHRRTKAVDQADRPHYQCRHHIDVTNDPDVLQQWVDDHVYSDKQPTAALDCEWTTGDRVDTLQIATANGFCIVYSQPPHLDVLPPCVIDMLTNRDVAKIGFAFHNDMKVIRRMHRHTGVYIVDVNLHDLQRDVEPHDVGYHRRRQKPSLARSVAYWLGIHLPKEHASSNWRTWPLPDNQVLYAASDACVLFDLARALHAPPTLACSPDSLCVRVEK